VQASGASRREMADSYPPSCLKIESVATYAVIARGGGRCSIPERRWWNRGAAGYWIPRIRGVWWLSWS